MIDLFLVHLTGFFFYHYLYHDDCCLRAERLRELQPACVSGRELSRTVKVCHGAASGPTIEIRHHFFFILPPNNMLYLMCSCGVLKFGHFGK